MNISHIFKLCISVFHYKSMHHNMLTPLQKIPATRCGKKRLYIYIYRFRLSAKMSCKMSVYRMSSKKNPISCVCRVLLVKVMVSNKGHSSSHWSLICIIGVNTDSFLGSEDYEDFPIRFTGRVFGPCPSGSLVGATAGYSVLSKFDQSECVCMIPNPHPVGVCVCQGRPS